jgi:hypothetical protein
MISKHYCGLQNSKSIEPGILPTPMLILRDHPFPKVEVVEGDPYFLQMDFDSKEVWSLPPPIHPMVQMKTIYL